MGKRRGHAGFFNTTYCATWPNALALRKKKEKKKINGHYLQLKRRKDNRTRLVHFEGSAGERGMDVYLPCPVLLSHSPPKMTQARLPAQKNQPSSCSRLFEERSAPTRAHKDHAWRRLQMGAPGRTRLLERIPIYNPGLGRWLVLGVNVTKCWFLESLKCLNTSGR